MNRIYAVFTPYPYRGGCEVCHSCDTCPSSQAREGWQLLDKIRTDKGLPTLY